MPEDKSYWNIERKQKLTMGRIYKLHLQFIVKSLFHHVLVSYRMTNVTVVTVGYSEILYHLTVHCNSLLNIHHGEQVRVD